MATPAGKASSDPGARYWFVPPYARQRDFGLHVSHVYESLPALRDGGGGGDGDGMWEVWYVVNMDFP